MDYESNSPVFSPRRGRFEREYCEDYDIQKSQDFSVLLGESLVGLYADKDSRYQNRDHDESIEMLAFRYRFTNRVHGRA